MERGRCEEQCHSVPSPLVGEGQGGGVAIAHRARSCFRSIGAAFVGCRIGNNRCACCTPLPVPPPQGGRERCGAHLRNSHDVPAGGLAEMCACPSAKAGTYAPQQSGGGRAAITETLVVMGPAFAGTTAAWFVPRYLSTLDPRFRGDERRLVQRRCKPRLIPLKRAFNERRFCIQP